MAQIWLRRLIEYKRKYNQVMQGRYATFDSLNRVLLILALFFRLFQFFTSFFNRLFLILGITRSNRISIVIEENLCKNK